MITAENLVHEIEDILSKKQEQARYRVNVFKTFKAVLMYFKDRVSYAEGVTVISLTKGPRCIQLTHSDESVVIRFDGLELRVGDHKNDTEVAGKLKGWIIQLLES